MVEYILHRVGVYVMLETEPSFFRIRVKTTYSQNEDSGSAYGYSELSLRSRLSLASGLEFSQSETRIMTQIVARTRALTSIRVRA